MNQEAWKKNNEPNPNFKLKTFDCSFEDYEWKSEELYGACHACGDDEVYRVEPDACCNPCPSCDEYAVMGYENLQIMGLINWVGDEYE